MTFPGAGARVYYNEAGEPLGWDYPNYDAPPDVDDYDRWADEPDDEEEDGDEREPDYEQIIEDRAAMRGPDPEAVMWGGEDIPS